MTSLCHLRQWAFHIDFSDADIQIPETLLQAILPFLGELARRLKAAAQTEHLSQLG